MGQFIRAVRVDDVDAMLEMISSVTPGLTTLLVDRSRLLERVERSHFAFTRKSESHAGEPYVLVMEDEATGRLVGTSTVYGKTGGYEPFYAYRVVNTTHTSPQLELYNRKRTTLHLQRIFDGPTEIGSLFLLPEFRGAGRGRLLSFSRFALIAQRPNRFANGVIAEMRGQCDEQGISPFWEAVMRPFFEVDFTVADSLSTVAKPFIEEMMPQFPLFVDLMPESVKEVIGQVHKETEPALRMLTDEGFKTTDMVDIFDAGPVVQCATASIGAVKRCVRREVATIGTITDGMEAIVSSKHEGFRATLTKISIDHDTNAVHIDSSTAKTLGVNTGEGVWCMTPR